MAKCPQIEYCASYSVYAMYRCDKCTVCDGTAGFD